MKYCYFDDNLDYLSIIQNTKVLSLYRLIDGKRIAHLPLYSDVNCLCMSHMYVVMGMQDRRILSYLIVDPKQPQHFNRIKQLESRLFII